MLVFLSQRVQHVERRHDIEAPACKRCRSDPGAHHVPAPQRSADPKADRRHVKSVSRPKFRYESQVGTGSATTVEDAGDSGAGERPSQKRCDEPSEAPKPEMTGFSARCRAQQIVHDVLYSFPISAI